MNERATKVDFGMTGPLPDKCNCHLLAFLSWSAAHQLCNKSKERRKTSGTEKVTAKERKGKNLVILCSDDAVSHDTDSLPSNCRHKGLGGWSRRTHPWDNNRTGYCFHSVSWISVVSI